MLTTSARWRIAILSEGSGAGLLDLDLNGYTLVSYRASHLPRQILAASEAMVVTRESDPREVETLFTLCQSCAGRRSADEWKALLGGLAIGEAVILPVTEEAEGEIRHIRLSPRLTPHVRHLAKYIDVPVMAGHAFVFWQNGAPTPHRVRTLRDFVGVIENAPESAFQGHLRRGDFSKWIEEVFGDYPLAAGVRAIERDRRAGGPGAIAQAIRARYDFLPPATDGPSADRARR